MVSNAQRIILAKSVKMDESKHIGFALMRREFPMCRNVLVQTEALIFCLEAVNFRAEPVFGCLFFNRGTTYLAYALSLGHHFFKLSLQKRISRKMFFQEILNAKTLDANLIVNYRPLITKAPLSTGP